MKAFLARTSTFAPVMIINRVTYLIYHFTVVAIVPYNGERFLATGSIDRSYKFWDLENLTTPQIYMQKSVIADGAWMTHWPCAVLSFDDALG